MSVKGLDYVLRIQSFLFPITPFFDPFDSNYMAVQTISENFGVDMSDDMMKKVLDAQTSDTLRNDFISENKFFILATASKSSGHYVPESDDEYSIALIAFNEAIDSYDESKGAFRPFAALVIRRRLYDYFRSESRFSQEISLEPAALTGEIMEEETSLHMEVRRREAEISGRDTATRPEGSPAKDEIEAMQGLLAKYGFSFFDLTECSPKAGKTKEAYKNFFSTLKNPFSNPKTIYVNK